MVSLRGKPKPKPDPGTVYVAIRSFAYAAPDGATAVRRGARFRCSHPTVVGTFGPL